MRPVCSIDGCKRPCKRGNKDKEGKVLYKKFCNKHNRLSYDKPDSLKKQLEKARTVLREKYGKPYLKFKKELCQSCGFIPEHPCQLDVDHIDGNHQNNCEDNLQTLCANCHRLKTWKNRDWESTDK